jgi:hypothetical protein
MLAPACELLSKGRCLVLFAFRALLRGFRKPSEKLPDAAVSPFDDSLGEGDPQIKSIANAKRRTAAIVMRTLGRTGKLANGPRALGRIGFAEPPRTGCTTILIPVDASSSWTRDEGSEGYPGVCASEQL